MYGVIFENGKVVYSNDSYSIYRMCNKEGNEYYLAIPMNPSSIYETVLYLSENNIGNLSEDDRQKAFIDELNAVINEVRKVKQDKAIYILVPAFSIRKDFENGQLKLEGVFDKVTKYVGNAGESIHHSYGQENISPLIIVINHSDFDQKFINWLIDKYGPCFIGFTFERKDIFSDGNDSIFLVNNPSGTNNVNETSPISNGKGKTMILKLGGPPSLQKDRNAPPAGPIGGNAAFTNMFFIGTVVLITIVVGIVLGYLIVK